MALKAPLVEWLILFNYGQIQLGDTFSVKLMSENFDAESTASATNPTWIKDNRGVYICQVALLGGDNDAAPIPTLYRTLDNKAPNTLKTMKKKVGH